MSVIRIGESRKGNMQNVFFFVFATVFGFHCLAFNELVSWSLHLVSNVRYTILQLTDGIQLLLMI